MIEPRTTEFHLVLRDDVDDERTVDVSLSLLGEDLPESLELRASVSDSAALTDDAVSLAEFAALVERWCEDHSATPLDHHATISASMPGGAHSQRESGTVQMKGTPPLRYPDVGTLPGKKGARTIAELPPIPEPASLSAVGVVGQRAFQELVTAAGGRLGFRGDGNSIPVGNLDAFVPVMEEWAAHYGSRRIGGLEMRRPGLWHAIDRLCPLQDPNRVDALRAAVLGRLEERGWVRNGVRGSSWWIPDQPGTPPADGTVVEILLADWSNEGDPYIDRPGRGYRQDLPVQDLVTINRGRWKIATRRAEVISEVVFTHSKTVVAVARVIGPIERFDDGRIAWESLQSINGDPRIGAAVERSYGNPIRHL
jgi:hypothetical protein